VQVAYRPSHADATYDMKYGVRAIAVRPRTQRLVARVARASFHAVP
jgi:chorismate synthase